MGVSKKIGEIMEKSSWIRKMFEEGARLKAQHGAENVFDFSLGNPILAPPEKFDQVLLETVSSCGPGDHCYMAQAGYGEVCDQVAAYLAQEQDVAVTGREVLMTCGAAGALNVILKALLDPGDEVLTPAPCFVEYRFYADNHGGVLKTVPTQPGFSLDLEAIAAAIGKKTKAIIINSPNNPTGKIYPADSLTALGGLLREKSRQLGRTLYLISDEPYRKIVFDDTVVPSVFHCYEESIVACSYSKDLSIPGERIGFAAVNPKAVHKSDLMGAMALTNRILGFVNAPALMQRVVSQLQGLSVDMGEYARKRDLLCDGLADCGYRFTRPAGAFYLFPKSPVSDDVEFVRALQRELILVVPGSGFEGPGYFRIAFCVDDQTIVSAMPGFKRTLDRYR